MCLAGTAPANESTRLTKSMVPVMMDGVCSPAYFQQMASSALPVYQAPFQLHARAGVLGSGAVC